MQGIHGRVLSQAPGKSLKKTQESSKQFVLLAPQDEMTSSLGLTTKKALTILRDQLSALLEGHQKERKKVTSWKVRHQMAEGWALSLPFSKES